MHGWIFMGAAPRRAEIQACVNEIGDFFHRDQFIAKFGFALPCAEAIEAIRELAPLVEIGAGSGSWAALLSNAGHDIVATDPALDTYGFRPGHWADVLSLKGDAAVKAYPDRDVLCIWPTLAANWATAAARAIAPGRRLALIGEGAGGCTGNKLLFMTLDNQFAQERVIAIPQWSGIHDRLEIYRKLR
jgi:hypothetical protein